MFTGLILIVGFVLGTKGLYLNGDRLPLYHILVLIFTCKTNGVDKYHGSKNVCARVRQCVHARFVLVGEEQQQEQTEAFSSHERGRERSKVSVRKSHFC